MERTLIVRPVRKIGPLFQSSRFKDVKDPCIAYDGTTWHMYGSGDDTFREEWGSGENGRASAIVWHEELYLFYQARS